MHLNLYSIGSQKHINRPHPLNTQLQNNLNIYALTGCDLVPHCFTDLTGSSTDQHRSDRLEPRPLRGVGCTVPETVRRAGRTAERLSHANNGDNPGGTAASPGSYLRLNSARTVQREWVPQSASYGGRYYCGVGVHKGYQNAFDMCRIECVCTAVLGVSFVKDVKAVPRL